MKEKLTVLLSDDAKRDSIFLFMSGSVEQDPKLSESVDGASADLCFGEVIEGYRNAHVTCFKEDCSTLSANGHLNANDHWYGTRGDAEALCRKCAGCTALHDWEFDAQNWRACTEVTADPTLAAGEGAGVVFRETCSPPPPPPPPPPAPPVPNDTNSATLGNDPFFVIRGERTHFWLPVATRTPLLKLVGQAGGGDGYTLLGTTFGDDRASQWFREYELKVGHLSKVRVQVGAPDTKVKGGLRTLQLWVNGKPFKEGASRPVFAGQGISVKSRQLPVKKILDEPAEEVAIVSPLLNVTIWSTAARKFAGPLKQLKFAHLNVDLNWAKVGASGLLAELAGDVPMRKSSRLLLQSARAGQPSIGIVGMERAVQLSSREQTDR